MGVAVAMIRVASWRLLPEAIGSDVVVGSDNAYHFRFRFGCDHLSVNEGSCLLSWKRANLDLIITTCAMMTK